MNEVSRQKIKIIAFQAGQKVFTFPLVRIGNSKGNRMMFFYLFCNV